MPPLIALLLSLKATTLLLGLATQGSLTICNGRDEVVGDGGAKEQVRVR
jgi:hypothetical protein